MCTLIFLYRFLDDYPVIAMHNRYAKVGDFEEPPVMSKGRLKAYHPTDSTSKGTWMGFNEAGLFVAVTDQHTGGVERFYRSRGLLSLDILTSFSKASDALRYLRSELMKDYRRGNFILADSAEAFHILSDEKIEVTPIKSGVHILTNITIRDWIRVDAIPTDRLMYTEIRRNRAIKLASEIKPTSINDVLDDLKRMASDHGDERGRGSICYHDDEWYMSSSTILAISKEMGNSMILYCRGNPCKGSFIDYSHILHDGENPMELHVGSGKLAGKRIALCLTGSVASIEAPKLARGLRRHGADVTCYMTRAAVDYGVSPKAMEWATSKPVVLELTGMVEHLTPYDLVIVYPATLNTICKVAHGIADNAVTTLCASTGPTKLLMAPAMNLRLYENEPLRESMEKLKRLGATFIEPRISEGAAKVANVEEVVDYAIRCLSRSPLKGRGILILAGPTRYDLDPVRYISNKASGRLGYWLAREAFHRGCRVKVVYGPGTVTFPRHIPVVGVYTAEDMLNATVKEVESGLYEVAIFSAAVLDFKPARYEARKVKSGESWSIELTPTVKIIDEVARRHPEIKIVGFKLEYNVLEETLIERAHEELKRTGAVLIVANDLREIRGELHKAHIIDREGGIKTIDGTKAELAYEIFNKLEENIIRA